MRQLERRTGSMQRRPQHRATRASRCRGVAGGGDRQRPVDDTPQGIATAASHAPDGGPGGTVAILLASLPEMAPPRAELIAIHR